MKPIGTSGRAGYRSELRQHQAATTRERILDATMRVLADGLAEVTMPAVAARAGVSVPTVYRHFATKRDLFAALQPHLQRRAGIDVRALPESLDELRGSLVTLLGRMDGLDDVARAALASPTADAVRRVHAPSLLKLTRGIVDAIAPQLPATDRERIARLLRVLTSSSAVRIWRDELGGSVEEVAAEIDGAVRAVIASADRAASR
jgi:AcrR family transcriptional regulator